MEGRKRRTESNWEAVAINWYNRPWPWPDPGPQPDPKRVRNGPRTRLRRFLIDRENSPTVLNGDHDSEVRTTASQLLRGRAGHIVCTPIPVRFFHHVFFQYLSFPQQLYILFAVHKWPMKCALRQTAKPTEPKLVRTCSLSSKKGNIHPHLVRNTSTSVQVIYLRRKITFTPSCSHCQ